MNVKEIQEKYGFDSVSLLKDATKAEKKAAKAKYRQQNMERYAEAGGGFMNAPKANETVTIKRVPYGKKRAVTENITRTVIAAGPVDIRKEKSDYIKKLDDEISRGENYIKSDVEQVKNLNKRISERQTKLNGMKALRRQIESAASKDEFEKAVNKYKDLRWSISNRASIMSF